MQYVVPLFERQSLFQGLRTLDFNVSSGRGRAREVVAPPTLGNGRATLHKVRDRFPSDAWC